MKYIFTFLTLMLTTVIAVGQTVSYPIYDGTFGGATHKQVFEFPTGAQDWAGFANNNKSIYPLDFPNGGKITFKASASAATSVKFKFEKDVHPDVNPSFETAVQAIIATETEYTIAISSQGTNTFKSALFYVVDRDVEVYISEVKIEKYDTDGSTVIATNYPIYDGTFGGATHKQVIEFPTGAENWGGFSNNNIGIYPLSFANGGEISFKASASAAANLNFKFEANPHPNVEPSYRTANIPITAAEGTYTVTIPSQGANTFNSALLYIVERDITVNISEVKITANAGDPNTNATLSDLQVDNTTIAGFSGAVTSYTYELTSGTTTVPQITLATATQAAGGATATITQATAIPGNATVEVTAIDGTTKQTYTVSYIDNLPATAAPTPPARATADVISLYSDAYTDVASNFDAGWCGATSVKEITVAGNATAAYLGNACQGIVLNAGVDASTFTNLHVDIYIEDGTDLTSSVFNLKFVQQPGGAALEINLNVASSPALVAGKWLSVDVAVDLTSFTGFKEFGITSNLNNKVWYDNLYVHKDTTLSVDDLTNGVSVYPSPMGDQVTVEGTWSVESVRIHDLTGREVLRAAPNKAVFSLDTSTLDHGVYLLSLSSDDNSITHKLVK